MRLSNNSCSRRYLNSFACSAIALSASLPGVTLAADLKEGFTLEEVVVTARRREENLQDTPIAVSAFTSSGLESRQIDTTDQLVRVTPNLQFSTQAPASGNNASSQIFIRGIGQSDFLPSTDPGVGMYLDGVYLARSVGAAMDFFDVERVEILRGPQGTLFGRNTIGGAINIVSKKPAEEFGGKAYVKVGSDNRLDLFATVDTPLSETVFAKFTAGSRDRDGYVTRLQTGEDVGDDNKENFRTQLRWVPNSDLEVNATVDYIDQDENGPPLVFNRINSTQAFSMIASGRAGCSAPGTEVNDPNCVNNQWAAGEFANNGTFPVYSTYELLAGNLSVDWDFSEVSFKSITGYRDAQWTGSRDADNTPLTVLHTAIDDSQWQFSQEFQLSGNTDKMKWLVGLYYFDEADNNKYFVETAPGTFSLDGKYENSTLAAFTNITYDFTENAHLTLGLRWFKEEKAFKPDQKTLTNYIVPSTVACSPVSALVDPGNALFNSSCFDDPRPPVIVFEPGVPLLPTAKVDREFTDVTPVVSFSYDLGETSLAYLSYSEGFKSGGFNGRQIFPLKDVPEFQEETASAIELGYKTVLFDNTLRLNTALFYTDYDDIQIVVRKDFAPLNINAGKATIQGLEGEFEYVPNANLIIQGSVGYTDAEFDELNALAIANGITTNNELAFTPELSVSLGAAYTFTLDGKGKITPRVDWNYQDSIYFDTVNTETMKRDAYSFLTASITWESENQDWQVSLAGNNLTDESYRTAGFSSYTQVAAYEEVGFGRGREWMLGLTYQF